MSTKFKIKIVIEDEVLFKKLRIASIIETQEMQSLVVKILREWVAHNDYIFQEIDRLKSSTPGFEMEFTPVLGEESKSRQRSPSEISLLLKDVILSNFWQSNDRCDFISNANIRDILKRKGCQEDNIRLIGRAMIDFGFKSRVVKIEKKSCRGYFLKTKDPNLESDLDFLA